MNRWTVLQVVTLVLGLVAAVISFNLLAKHLSGSSGSAWFESGCSDREGPGAANCAAVLASRYGTWPARRDSEPEGTPHIPVAFLGLIYYTALAIWITGVGRPSRARRWIHLLPLGVLSVGLLCSAFYTYVMSTQISEWCPWCLATHGLNACIAACFVLMWPRRSRRGVAMSGAASGREPAHPSARLVLATLVAIGAALFGQAQLLGKANAAKLASSAKAGFDHCMAAVDRIKADATTLLGLWRRSEQRTIPILPDEPLRLNGPQAAEAMVAVVFSDFACPPCGRLAEFMEKNVQPLFDHRLPVLYRYYPLDTHCNQRVSRTMYEHGCEAVALAEAARMLGGTEAFWRAHDFLFAHQPELKRGALTSADVAVATGLDPEAFAEAVDPVAAAQRIGEHVAHAAACEINGTPTLFVDGRQVDRLAVTEVGFWDLLADEFWTRLGQPRPASTRRITTAPPKPLPPPGEAP